MFAAVNRPLPCWRLEADDARDLINEQKDWKDFLAAAVWAWQPRDESAVPIGLH